jgi:hypothetical protein
MTRWSASRRPRAPSGTDWALGVEARSRALVSDDGAAEPCYRDAIEHLGAPASPANSRGRICSTASGCAARPRTDAREQLRTAHQMFGDMGMEAFAECAR